MSIIGTPSYMAPELINSIKYEKPVDIWAIGIVLYNLCMFKEPFADENEIINN